MSSIDNPCGLTVASPDRGVLAIGHAYEKAWDHESPCPCKTCQAADQVTRQVAGQVAGQAAGLDRQGGASVAR